MNQEQKKEIYNNWALSGYQQSTTKEELDVIVELQSKGYKTNTYVVKEQDNGTKYSVTELREPKIKQEKDMATLINEAKKYLQKQEPKQNKELEQSIKKWDKYYKDNQGKIPRDIPKTFFDY